MENDKKKIKYPKYTREQNLACKLTDKQIADIRRKKSQGYKIKKLMSLYKVCKGTILYWTSEETRKKSIARSSINARKRFLDYPKKGYEISRKSILMKKSRSEKEINEYNRTHKSTERTKFYNKMAWEIV